MAKTKSSSSSTSRPAAAKKKRVRKPSKNGHNKPKHPPVKLAVRPVYLFATSTMDLYEKILLVVSKEAET